MSQKFKTQGGANFAQFAVLGLSGKMESVITLDEFTFDGEFNLNLC